MTIYPTEVPLPADVLGKIRIIRIERSGRYDPGFFGRILTGIREFKPDIVHAHLHNGKYWGRLAAMLARVPIVLYTEHNPCGEKRIFPEIAVDVVVNQITNGIITFAETQRALLARAERLPLAKVAVIENGILLPPLPTPNLRAEARRRLGARDDEVTVLVVGRLIEQKNQQLAIQAAQRLASRSRDRIRFYIVGSGEDDSMLRELAKEKEVSDSVRFTGYREDVVQLLYGGDLLYVPSFAEGMPLAMLEAMSVGLPIVSTPWVGVTELLRDGDLGTILRDWEPETSATVFERALQSPEAFRQLGTKARDVVRELYDINRIARMHEALYRDLAQRCGLQMPISASAAAAAL